MKVCWCTLAGTMACKNCPNNSYYTGLSLKEVEEFYNKKPKRIIEKFDQDGKLIERITEE